MLVEPMVLHLLINLGKGDCVPFLRVTKSRSVITSRRVTRVLQRDGMKCWNCDHYFSLPNKNIWRSKCFCLVLFFSFIFLSYIFSCIILLGSSWKINFVCCFELFFVFRSFSALFLCFHKIGIKEQRKWSIHLIAEKASHINRKSYFPRVFIGNHSLFSYCLESKSTDTIKHENTVHKRRTKSELQRKRMHCKGN